MARLSATERHALPDRAFADVDVDAGGRGRRRLPIHDASHVRNALSRFARLDFADDVARDRARDRLLKAARRFRIVPIGFIAHELDVAQRVAAGARRDLPTGFVTLLMTEVEGSTALVHRLGARFGDLVDEMWGELRSAIERHGGCEVEARADEFFAAFEAPRAAVDAAVAIQLAFGDRSFADETPVRVRIGIHSGYPTSTPGNYVGVDVNATSRITALGHGGQILASAPTREAVQATNAHGLRFVSLGTQTLRGLADPMPLYQVTAAGLARRFPPLRS